MPGDGRATLLVYCLRESVDWLLGTTRWEFAKSFQVDWTDVAQGVPTVESYARVGLPDRRLLVVTHTASEPHGDTNRKVAYALFCQTPEKS